MLELIGALAGLLFGTIGTLIAVRNHISTLKKNWEDKWNAEIERKVDSEKRAYAAQRDFEHLRRNQEQMKQALEELQEENSEMSKLLVELRSNHSGMFHQLSNLAARFDNSTSGFNRQG